MVERHPCSRGQAAAQGSGSLGITNHKIFEHGKKTRTTE